MRHAALALIFAAGLLAQQPNIQNAELRTHSASQGLEAAFQGAERSQQGPAWIGYGVPGVDEHTSCCAESARRCICSLESHNGRTFTNSKQVKLEGPYFLFVLFRVEKRQVDRIELFSEDCELDAGGLPFYWLTDVNPAQSIHLLAGFAQGLGDSAVAAIALHKDAEADRVLEGFVSPGQPEALRKRTVFWLGNARAHRGYEILDGVLRDDPSTEVRSQAVFAMSISHDPAALRAMIRAAHEDRSPHVRGQALFWLAQKASQKIAVQAITDAIENDPETEVKKQAVFALSQMPPEQGTPLLIHQAQTNRNREVRKRAMFWLGQSNDPRALEFFEQVLTSK